MNKWYQDKDGNVSSKRILGSILIGCGLMLLMGLGISSFFHIAKDSRTILEVCSILMTTGGALVGAGIFENINIGGTK